MFDINAIKNHILYLKTKCNLFVSLHALDYNSLVNLDHLNMFAIHDNPYCAYIKSSYNAYCHCLLNQHRVIIKGQNGSFQGICYAGVQEYVYPIHKGKYTVGMVCVSGYQCENAMQYLNHVSIKYDLNFEKLSKAYRKLKTELPPKDEIDRLIFPLCEMLELAFIQSHEQAPSVQSFAEKLVQYLNENYTNNISSRDLCNLFSVSRSYLSREFNLCTGKTLKKYLTELRIRDALALLESSSASISEIAYTVGFNDSNYFSTVFKSQIGMTPKAYRKKAQSL